MWSLFSCGCFVLSVCVPLCLSCLSLHPLCPVVFFPLLSSLCPFISPSLSTLSKHPTDLFREVLFLFIPAETRVSPVTQAVRDDDVSSPSSSARPAGVCARLMKFIKDLYLLIDAVITVGGFDLCVAAACIFISFQLQCGRNALNQNQQDFSLDF